MARLAALIALLLAAAAAVASCGGDDISPDSVAEAAANTLGARTAHATIRATVENDALPAPVRMTGDGDVDFRHKLTQLRMRAAIPGTDQQFQIDEILEGEGLVMYMSSPQLAAQLPGGKDWVKIDLVKTSKQLGIDLSALPQGSQSDPMATLRYLKSVSDVEKVGDEELDGVPTTHYKATIDVRRYVKLVPQERRAAARRSVDRLVELMGGKSTIPVEVWVDENELVRRQTMEMDTKLADGGVMHMRMEFGLSDFGTDVDVDVPDDADTVDATELAGAGG
jgi:hypothetical protein